MARIVDPYIISRIEYNCGQESEAAQYYFELLYDVDGRIEQEVENGTITQEDADAFRMDIESIISDERDHRRRLERWSQKWSKIPIGS